MNNAVCLLSGGQDSTTALFWAKRKFDKVFAVIIDYGQKHRVEIESAKKIADIANVDYNIIPVPFFAQLGDSSLTGPGNVSDAHNLNPNLPSSFVPGRNIIFMTVAAMVAYKLGYENVVTGVCETDYSGYPDCRRQAVDAVESAVSLGMDVPFIEIHTPLMYLSKLQTVKMAKTLDGCMEALKYSHTCYNGVWPPCGVCPSCKLRAKGFEEAGEMDPIFSREVV